MFDKIFGVPILITQLNITDSQLLKMKNYMSKLDDLTDSKSHLYTGDTSDDLIESQILSHPTFQCLQKPIIELTKSYLREVTSTSEEFQPYIMKSWPVVVKNTGHVEKHSHHYAHLSSVFYLDHQEPNKKGELVFMKDGEHPLCNMGINPTRLDEDLSQVKCSLRAEKNKLVIFPSNLLHYVSTNLSKHTRYSVSCDIINTKVKGDTEGCVIPPDRWITT